MTQLKLRIAENRRKLGLTQEQLANQLGICLLYTSCVNTASPLES